MATVTRGKRKGERVTLHQWSNDWFTTVEDTKVFSPASLRLDKEEIEMVRVSFEEGRAGIMPGLYELRDDGTFRRRRHVPVRKDRTVK